MIDTVWIERLADSLGDGIAEPVSARLGHPVTQAIVVADTDTDIPMQVYIHGIGDEPQSLSTALNPGVLATVDLIFGLPVLVRQKRGRFVLEGQDPYRAVEYLSGVKRDDQLPVSIAQLNFALLQPTSPTSMKLFVSEGFFVQSSTLYRLADTYTADFSASPLDTLGSPITVPTTNLRAKAVLVQVDAVAKSLSYKQGAEFDVELTHGQAFDAGLYPQRDASRFALGYARLTKGITAIEKHQVYVTPELFNPGAANFSDLVNKLHTHLDDANGGTLTGEAIASGTVAAARLGVMTGDSGAGGAKGAAPAPAAGDAAKRKYLTAAATWEEEPVDWYTYLNYFIGR